jgi:ABC-type transport system substrate-binding protein
MPFLDRIEFRIEKEKQSVYSKFIQGFYDIPISYRFEPGMKFDVDAKNSDDVARLLRERHIELPKTLQISNWYVGFNWWDPVVGKGKTVEQQERNRKLRQALSIAIDWEEFTHVFDTKASGEAAMSPVPPGVFGFRGGTEGINRVVYDVVDGKPVRKSIDAARALLAEAGYPGGRDAKSGKPLVLNYDYQRALTPEFKSEVDWMVKQFAKLGVQLEVRATDYNRFQDKMNNGTEQIFWWGWDADYPDAENFLFLLYGPNSKAATHGNGENTANYQNDEFDRLFARFKYQDDGPEKQALIDQMVQLVQHDAPWSFGYNPYAFGANQQWVYNAKPAPIVKDYLEYVRIDPALRTAAMAQWNRPITWPLWLLLAALALLVGPALVSWRRRERMTAARRPAGAAAGDAAG